jgi:sec-independent protein translocase protein TatB
MFDLDISKMIIVGIVALAVIPPKDLPRVMRTVGQTIGKMRRMATDFQRQFMEAMREVEREADLESVKKEFQAINDQAKIDTSFDPVGMMRDDMTKAVATSASASEAADTDPGKSEVALTGPEPAAAAAPGDREEEPEAPAVRRSAAE